MCRAVPVLVEVGENPLRFPSTQRVDRLKSGFLYFDGFHREGGRNSTWDRAEP
jgi:hypothetical protein